MEKVTGHVHQAEKEEVIEVADHLADPVDPVGLKDQADPADQANQ